MLHSEAMFAGHFLFSVPFSAAATVLFSATTLLLGYKLVNFQGCHLVLAARKWLLGVLSRLLFQE